MKKILTFLMIAALSACGTKNDEGNTKNTAENISHTTKRNTFVKTYKLSQGLSENIIFDGFHQYMPEEKGFWSKEEIAQITFQWQENTYQTILFDVMSFSNEKSPNMEVDVYANDIKKATWIFEHPYSNRNVRALTFCPTDFKSKNLTIKFVVQSPKTRDELFGDGEKEFKFGIVLRDITIYGFTE